MSTEYHLGGKWALSANQVDWLIDHSIGLPRQKVILMRSDGIQAVAPALAWNRSTIATNRTPKDLTRHPMIKKYIKKTAV